MKKISLNQVDVIMTALRKKYNHWDNPDIHFEIYEIDDNWRWRDDHKLVLGINWAAIGTVSTKDTVKFANSLIEVSKIIDKINSREYVVDEDLDDNIETKEQFNYAVDMFIELILN